MTARHVLSSGLVVVLTCATAATAATAQGSGDSVRAARDSVAQTAPPQRARPDSLRPPLSPGRAFLHSLFLPGLGQSRLRRPLPGAVYYTVEAVSIAMLLKTRNDLRIAREQSADVIVNRYEVDPVTGAPLLDPNGRFVPRDTVPNRFDSERVNARRTQVEDWIAVLAFNHLFAGADAFVASLLWDLPSRVGFRPAPFGFGAGMVIRW